MSKRGKRAGGHWNCRVCGKPYDPEPRDLERTCSADCQARYEIERYFEFEAREYRKNPNPTLAWRAIYKAGQLKLPLPNWVMEYLTLCASRIVEASEITHGKQHEAELLGRLIGFGGSRGRAGPLAQHRQWIREGNIADQVAREWFEAPKLDAAYEIVATKAKSDARTVRRAFTERKGSYFLPNELKKRKSKRPK